MTSLAIHLTEWRQMNSSDPKVVMVHGSAQGSRIGGDRHFSVQSRLATQGWHVIVPDRPGHGRSPSPGRPDDPKADGAWVAPLLGDGAHLVGHSFGGAVALAGAAINPSAVKSLTLIEPAMQTLAVADPRVQAFLQSLMAAMGGASSPADLAVRFAKLVAIPDEIRGGSNPQELERMGQALQQLKLPTPDDIRAELATIKAAGIALLVVSGGWNPAFTAVCDMVAELGGGRHVIIPSEHHFPQLVSGEFNDLLVAHMTAAGG